MAAARRSELGGVRDVGFSVPCLSLSSSVSYDGGGDDDDFSQALTDLCRMAFAGTTDDQIDALAVGGGHHWLTVDDTPIHPAQPLQPPSLQGPPFANAELLLQHGGGVVGGRTMMGGNGGRRLVGGQDLGSCDRSAAMYVPQYGSAIGALGGGGGGGGLAPKAMVRDSVNGSNPYYYLDNAFDQPLGVGGICNDVLLPGGTGSSLSTIGQSSADQNAALRNLGELHYALDIPLLSDDDDAVIHGNYLMLTDDLASLPSGSLVGETTEKVQTNCQQVIGQLTMPQMSSGCTVASLGVQREESIASYLTGGYTNEDVPHRASETLKNLNPTRGAAAGSRKVLKANRRLKEKNSPMAAQSTKQSSVPKPMAEKTNQARVTRYVMKCLMDYGICVVDRYMGLVTGSRILNEVQNLEVMGLFQEGQLICQTDDTQTIRGDRIMWVERDSDKLKHITVLIRQLDSLLESLNGQIMPYQIKSRSKVKTQTTILLFSSIILRPCINRWRLAVVGEGLALLSCE